MREPQEGRVGSPSHGRPGWETEPCHPALGLRDKGVGTVDLRPLEEGFMGPKEGGELRASLLSRSLDH